VYAPAESAALRIMSPTGAISATIPVGGQADHLAVSPDGRRAVVTLESRLDLVDLERGVTERIAFDTGEYRYPAWLPDGKRVSFRYRETPRAPYQVVVLDLSSGTREVLMEVDADPTAGGVSSWSRDGRTMFGNAVGPKRNHDLFRASIDERPVALTPFVATAVGEFNARLSPDERLLAFLALYQGPPGDIFVQPVAGGERVRVSPNGGTDPNWGPGGREIFFRTGNRLFAAAVTTTAGRVAVGSPRLVMERPLYGGTWAYGVRPDGSLVTLEIAEPVRALKVVLNWPALLARPNANSQ
jgi:hypothetical protein